MPNPEKISKGPKEKLNPGESVFKKVLNLDNLKKSGLARSISEYISKKEKKQIRPDDCICEINAAPRGDQLRCGLKISYRDPDSKKFILVKNNGEECHWFGRYIGGDVHVFYNFLLGGKLLSEEQKKYLQNAFSAFNKSKAIEYEKKLLAEPVDIPKKQEKPDASEDFDNLTPGQKETVMELASLKLRDIHEYEKEISNREGMDEILPPEYLIDEGVRRLEK